MERLLHDKIDCLDHGYVQLTAVMGNDRSIVDAARLSISGENVKSVQEDRGLIRYLMRHRHSSPFEQVQFQFMMKMPIFVARQFIRHRTSSVNELSGRYSEMPEEYYVPEAENISHQSTMNKQGRSDMMDDAIEHVGHFRNEAIESFTHYRTRIGRDMARELARINLPLSTYTQWIWSQNLHNLFHLLSLRMDKHSQYEIRVFAEAIASIVKQVCPIAYGAFEDYRLNSMTFSRQEVEAIKTVLFLSGVGPNKGFQASHVVGDSFPTKREALEFDEKLKLLGVYQDHNI